MTFSLPSPSSLLKLPNNAFMVSKNSLRGAKLVFRDSSNFLRGANNRSNATQNLLIRETQNSLRGTNNRSNATEKLLRGAKYFLCGANNRSNATQNLQETQNCLRGRNSLNNGAQKVLRDVQNGFQSSSNSIYWIATVMH